MRFESTQNPNAHAASGRIAPHAAETVVSRGDWIRTSDLPAPSRMRYQTAPRPGAGASLGQVSVRPCKEAKPLDEFTPKGSRGGRDSYCRPCRRVYGRAHYQAHRRRYIEKAGQRRRLRRRVRAEFFIEYFASHPCVDCGETDPVVLEFDHIGEKEFDVAYGFERFGWERILREMAKCEVVCANCHRRRTCRRAGSWRAVLTGLVDEAGGGSRTRAESLEGSSAAVTPRPQTRPSLERNNLRTDKGPGEPGPPPCL